MKGTNRRRRLRAVDDVRLPPEAEVTDPLDTDPELLADLARAGLIQEGAEEVLASPPGLTVVTALLSQGLELEEVHVLVTTANQLAEQARERLRTEIAGFGSQTDNETALALAQLVCADALTDEQKPAEPEDCCRNHLRLVPPPQERLHGRKAVRTLP